MWCAYNLLSSRFVNGSLITSPVAHDRRLFLPGNKAVRLWLIAIMYTRCARVLCLAREPYSLRFFFFARIAAERYIAAARELEKEEKMPGRYDRSRGDIQRCRRRRREAVCVNAESSICHVRVDERDLKSRVFSRSFFG